MLIAVVIFTRCLLLTIHHGWEYPLPDSRDPGSVVSHEPEELGLEIYLRDGSPRHSKHRYKPLDIKLKHLCGGNDMTSSLRLEGNVTFAFVCLVCGLTLHDVVMKVVVVRQAEGRHRQL